MLELNKDIFHETLNQELDSPLVDSSSIKEIERISNLSYKQFFENYLKSNKPCVATGLGIESWNSSREWVANDGQPNFEFLEQKFGTCTVPVADCHRREYNSQHKTNMLLKEYLSYWKTFDDNKVKSSYLYLKDWHFSRQYPDYKAYETPEYYSSDWLNEFCEMQNDDYKFVYMGPKGTWTPLHADVFGSYSWSVNICGRKRWLLFPPGQEKLLQDEKKQMLYLLKDSDLIKRNVLYLDVIQETGEIIFVPSGWYHQVWNLENTISINHNWFNGCNILYIWHCLQSAATDVENEISDCKASEDWEHQWQVILRVHHGFNYSDFLEILKFIFISRSAYLQSLNKEDKSETWEQVFDVLSVKEVCTKMLSCKLPHSLYESVKSLESLLTEFISKMKINIL